MMGGLDDRANATMGLSMTMKAAKLGEDGNLSVVDHPMPIPGAGEALIQIVQAGICNTDIEITSRGS